MSETKVIELFRNESETVQISAQVEGIKRILARLYRRQSGEVEARINIDTVPFVEDLSCVLIYPVDVDTDTGKLILRERFAPVVRTITNQPGAFEEIKKEVEQFEVICV